VPWYFAFFVVSGLCGLIYEIVWLRLAMAAFGVTTPFISIVVSVFMAGLAVGTWGAGHLVQRVRASDAATSLRLYAIAELLIGLSGIVVPWQLGWGHAWLATTGGGVAWDSGSYYLASGGLITLTLLPYCVCMGATFPLAMSAMRREFGSGAEKSFSYLYVANVAGATLGTLLGAFVLIELLGFQQTLYVAAALNTLLAVTAWARSASVRAAAAEPPPALATTPVARAGPAPRAILLWLFLTGVVSMAMELVWIRQFTVFLGTFVYTFAGILALYLVATCLGSQAYRARSRRGGVGPTGVASLAWTVVGLLALLPLVTWDFRLPLPPVVRVALGIAPFCFAVGFITPMLIDRWSGGDPARAGLAYGLNVLGSLIGPLLAGFFLLPVLGERWALVALAVPLFAAGLIAAAWPPIAGVVTPPSRSGLGFAGVLFAAMVLVGASHDPVRQGGTREVRRDHTATVIATGTGMAKRLFINGVGTTYLTPVTKMMAHLPVASFERRPQAALTVAFGMGTTFRSLLSWEIPSVAVELVPSVPELFGYFHADARELMQSSLARLVIDDGRRFLERSAEEYDVIIIDPPPPVEAAGSSLLYSREFYAIVKRRLRSGGIVQQWFPHGEGAILTSITRALTESFPYVRAFGSVEGWGVHFLASTRPIESPPAAVLASRVPPRAAIDLLEWGPAATVTEQFDRVLSREVPVGALLASDPSVAALSDDHPFNEYFLLRRQLPLALW
jgi:spermidine synthase